MEHIAPIFFLRNQLAESYKRDNTRTEFGAVPYISNSLHGTVKSMKSFTSVTPSAYSSEEDGMEDVDVVY